MSLSSFYHTYVCSGVGFFRVNKKGHVTQFDDVDSFHLFKLTREENGQLCALHVHVLFHHFIYVQSHLRAVRVCIR